jgi:hypothetical protein
MKKFNKIINIIALVMVISFSLLAIACDNLSGESSGGARTDPAIHGTWGPDSTIYILGMVVTSRDTITLKSDGTFVGTTEGVQAIKGKYTADGSTFVATATEVNADVFAYFLDEIGIRGWYDNHQLTNAVTARLRQLGYSNTEIGWFLEDVNEIFKSETGTYYISGNTLSIYSDGQRVSLTRR